MPSQDPQRLFELLRRTLSAEQALPLQSRELEQLSRVMAELAEALASVHQQAVAFELDSADELAALCQSFASLHPDFLSHARQKAICYGSPILGFCGGFSAGKSTFLNLLINRREDEPLPTKATRDTALPVFLVPSTASQLWIENHRGSAFLNATPRDLYLFRHSEEQSFEPWSYLVKHLYLFSASFDPSQVVYLDLPGHTAGAEDLQLSLNAARQCDAIVYLIDVNQGDLKPTDIEFLNQLTGLHPPVLVLLTKCDEAPPSKHAAVQKQVTATLDAQGIPYEGPHLWTKQANLAALRNAGIQVVREYASRLARQSQDRWFQRLDGIVSRVIELGRDDHHYLKAAHQERLAPLEELAGSPLPKTVFTRAREIAVASRSVGAFIDDGFLSKTFQGDSFRQKHYDQAAHWQSSCLQGYPGLLNILTFYGMYATLADAIDESGWHASIHYTSPPGSSDQWYYEHLQRLEDIHTALAAEIGTVHAELKAAGRRTAERALELNERAAALRKRLKHNYQKLRTASSMEG